MKTSLIFLKNKRNIEACIDAAGGPTQRKYAQVNPQSGKVRHKFDKLSCTGFTVPTTSASAGQEHRKASRQLSSALQYAERNLVDVEKMLRKQMLLKER